MFSTEKKWLAKVLLNQNSLSFHSCCERTRPGHGRTAGSCLAMDMAPGGCHVNSAKSVPPISEPSAPPQDAGTALCRRLHWKPGCSPCANARCGNQTLPAQNSQGHSELVPVRHSVTFPMFNAISLFSLVIKLMLYKFLTIVRDNNFPF